MFRTTDTFKNPSFRLHLAVLLVLGCAFCLPRPARAAAAADEEQHLIQVLQSDSSPAQKDAACARLKFIGTARCVPALASLLTDDQLSHSARYALEAMHFQAAGHALIEALPRTSGHVRVGIINSLEARGDREAVPFLASLLNPTIVNGVAKPVSNADPEAIASARALGAIGGAAALKALKTSLPATSGGLHEAEVDALLRCANRFLVSRSHSKARALFEQLYQSEPGDAVRMAAYRGLIESSGGGSLRLMTFAISGPAGPQRTAALQMVHEIQAPGATRTLAALLPDVAPDVQVSLIESLAQRNDPAAVSAITRLATSDSPQVRLAVIRALGPLGDSSIIAVLAGFAAHGPGEEQTAARESLDMLHRGGVAHTMIVQLSSAAPHIQAELARALGDRRETGAIPDLVEVARRGNDSARHSALDALALLVEEPQLVSLVQFVLDAPDDHRRAEAAEALNTACQRLQLKYGHIDAAAVARGLDSGSPDARMALLPVCSGLVARPVRIALRRALTDGDPQLRAAAIRAVCDTVDTDFLLDLVELSHSIKDQKLRTLIIGGCVRLATQGETPVLSKQRRIDALRGLLAVSVNPEQARLVLAGLAELPDPDTLKLTEPMLADPNLNAEAARAAVQIATALPPSENQDSMALLKKALASASDDDTRKAVQAGLNELEASADYITAWEMAGPYSQAGKDYSALFDIVFPPEPSDAAVTAIAAHPPEANIVWKILPPCADPRRPYVMDLLKAIGGQERVAYARTWIHSDDPQTARLEIGSDDGVKVWLNDKLVHANNVARALKPAQDRVQVSLNKGWNLLLLKVTQHNQGWEFCVRLLKPDGAHMDGLTFDTTAHPK